MLLFLALPFLLLSCGDGKKENAEQAGTDTTAATPAPEPAAPAVSTIVTTPQNMVMILHKVANFQNGTLHTMQMTLPDWPMVCIIMLSAGACATPIWCWW